MAREAWRQGPVDIGGGLRVSAYPSGKDSHGWWGTVVLLLVSASLYGMAVFSYLYLWTVAPATWPAPSALPGWGYPLVSAGLAAASSGAIVLATRSLDRPLRLTRLSQRGINYAETGERPTFQCLIPSLTCKFQRLPIVLDRLLRLPKVAMCDAQTKQRQAFITPVAELARDP